MTREPTSPGRRVQYQQSIGSALILYRSLAGVLPEWPYRWPLEGHGRLRRRARELSPVLQRALEVDARRRYRDAGAMLRAFDAARRALERRLRRGGGP